jgi:ribonuclease HI
VKAKCGFPDVSLTPRRKQHNITARQNDDRICFDPTITCKENLAECFHVFTNPEKISNLPAKRYHMQGFNPRHREVEIHTDGACFDNGKLNARCRSGIWFGPNDARNTSIKVPGPLQSNQVGETAAVIKALTSVPHFWPITIITDSKYVIDSLTTHLQTWEDRGWIGIKNAKLLKRAAYLLK